MSTFLLTWCNCKIEHEKNIQKVQIYCSPANFGCPLDCRPRSWPRSIPLVPDFNHFYNNIILSFACNFQRLFFKWSWLIAIGYWPFGCRVGGKSQNSMTLLCIIRVILTYFWKVTFWYRNKKHILLVFSSSIICQMCYFICFEIRHICFIKSQKNPIWGNKLFIKNLSTDSSFFRVYCRSTAPEKAQLLWRC